MSGSGSHASSGMSEAAVEGRPWGRKLCGKHYPSFTRPCWLGGHLHKSAFSTTRAPPEFLRNAPPALLLLRQWSLAHECTIYNSPGAVTSWHAVSQAASLAALQAAQKVAQKGGQRASQQCYHSHHHLSWSSLHAAS